MSYLRIGSKGGEVPVWRGADSELFDLRPVTRDIDPDFFASDGPARVANSLAEGRLSPFDAAEQRVGPPLSRPGKIVCIGLNYSDHAAETGTVPPTEPVVFLKAANTIVGPNDSIMIPPRSTKTDWEAELGVVIGSTARYLPSPREAERVIAGYVLSNDVSEREFQLERGGQWDKGKSCETFNPLGPAIVTQDELPDPHSLQIRLWVNGELRQNGSTSNMIFKVPYIIWYLSRFMVLEPGDLINTGTPAGVALGLAGQPYLRPGDVVELESGGLGRQRQKARDARVELSWDEGSQR